MGLPVLRHLTSIVFTLAQYDLVVNVVDRTNMIVSGLAKFEKKASCLYFL